MAIFPNLYVPDERDLRFASTGSNYNPRNTQCMDACPAVFERGGCNFRLPPAQSPGFSTRSKSGIFALNSNKNHHFSKVSQPYARYYPVRRNKLTGLRRVTGSG